MTIYLFCCCRSEEATFENGLKHGPGLEVGPNGERLALFFDSFIVKITFYKFDVFFYR